MIRIILADYRSKIRSALRLLLETRLDVDQIIEAQDMDHLQTQLVNYRPDCLILDWNLPGLPIQGRVSLLRSLVTEIKIIAIDTTSEQKDQIMIEGVDAFICKTDPPAKLLEVLYEFCQTSDKKIEGEKDED